MLKLFLSGIFKLLNLGSWIGEFLHDRQVAKQTTTNVELQQTKQELSDVVKANEFDDHIHSDPAYAERMRDLLNNQK